jgi:ATP-dependent Lon protease
MPSGSAEGTVIRNYLDWILELPWNYKTEEIIDLQRASDILDEDHYGLAKVKERILEYLSVRMMKKDLKGPILCLVGPPGVGKTSIAKSIARALNRNYVRMSLGGVKDEAEIRGHRKTYVGSMPGRIIASMKQAGSKNPLVLLDEIDKMSSDYKGDPASAMLEVLDGEQNFSFRDHYIELPFDLSDVMFLTTANNLDTIPRALLDRLEIIQITSYTEDEKANIAIKYLIPKQKEAHGLKKSALKVDEKTVRDIINFYTREAGVRNLERTIATLCRKSARKLIEEKKKSITLTSSSLEKLLGVKKFRSEKQYPEDQIGIATGLAWTPVGGDTLFIEVSVVVGKGKLELTGQLGDVMKESARAAISYIRSKVKELGISEDFYSKYDIHIHVPEGATPKDGPSAGITLMTAMVSALTGIPVRHEVAMTGEITLRGRVIAIGGLKEKVYAAHRAGVKTIIIPMNNKQDLEDIPENIKECINFIFAENADTVLKHALSVLPTRTMPNKSKENQNSPKSSVEIKDDTLENIVVPQ